MRTNRALAIAAAFGFGVSFGASANVVYDSETTNKWFNANIKTSSTLASEWARPRAGEVVVKGESDAHYFALDTDLDDPLIYMAAEASEDVAVVAAEMTATVNASVPDLGSVPQAALCVIGTASATNWVGLVGIENDGTNWVTFSTPVPVAGETYSVRIEFDQRQGAPRRIRYLVDGVVLSGEGSTDGWYPNPQAGTAKISNVSFSGSGDIKALAGESITENTIAFDTPTEAEGFDYTNGVISVSAAIQGYKDVTAILTVSGTDAGDVKVVQRAQSSANWSWDLNDLTQGGIYSYTIEAQVGGKTIATKTGTFTAATWPTNIWFGADASKSTPTERVKGGEWADAEPTVENATYVIDDGAVFDVSDQEPGSNHVTRVDTKVTFETLVDANSLSDVTDEQDALGGFVAAKSGETPQWMALTKKDSTVQWVALSGGIEPEVNVPYVIRAEVDSLSESKCVRYLVSEDDGKNFVPLASDGTSWIAFADANKGSLAKVELKGSGKVAKFEAKVADKALAVVDGVEYDSMAEALAAAGTNGEHTITLLTSATIEPTKAGAYDIAPGGHHYMSGGIDSTEARAIVVTEPGQPPVERPSKAVMEKVQTPDKKSYKNIKSLRDFLEKNRVEAYTGNKDATAIGTALNDVPANSNGLPLWQDYVMGIEQTDSVTPEYTPSADVDSQNFSLQVPALGAAIGDNKPSGDYAIKYKINQDKSVKMPATGIIPVVLPDAAADYNVRIVLEPIE